MLSRGWKDAARGRQGSGKDEARARQGPCHRLQPLCRVVFLVFVVFAFCPRIAYISSKTHKEGGIPIIPVLRRCRQEVKTVVIKFKTSLRHRKPYLKAKQREQ